MPLIEPGGTIMLPDKVRKVLVCQLRQIGDVLLATPCIELLRRRFPDAEIHVFTEKKCSPMLENNPDVARVWAVDKKELSHLGRELVFYRRVVREGFDIVVDFQQLPRCRWVAAFSRARVRLTYPPKWYNRPWYTHWYRMTDGYSAMFRASLLEPLGIRWNGEPPRLFLSREEQQWARDYLDGLGLGGKGDTTNAACEADLADARAYASAETAARVGRPVLVSVDPTHRRYTRQWPPESFGRALSLALRARSDLRFILFCGPGEESVLHQVVEAMDPELRDMAVIPDRILTLREMAAVIRECALHLGNCSAPRHLAVAVDTPSLVLHGATRESAWTYPGLGHEAMAADLPCRPCNRNSCDSPDKGLDDFPPCLRRLAPEKVAERMLERLVG